MYPAIAMDLNLAPHITITKRDLGKLNNMIGAYAPIISWKAAGFLLGELRRARIVATDAISPTTITINSQVEIRDDDTGETSVMTLVLPNDLALYRDSVSVLTALGTALVGLSNGQSISYIDREKAKKITVLKVLYQPEAERWFRQAPRIR